MKYFIGLVFCVILVAMVAMLVVRGFNHADSKPAGQKLIALEQYANTDKVVQMTVDGPVVGEPMHKGYRIVVGKSQVTMYRLQGYEPTIQDQYSFDNNQKGFAVFLRAIGFAGFAKGDKLAPADVADDRGFCANGYRYTFEVLEGTKATQRFWTSTCGGGTFKGNVKTTKHLFDQQIPIEQFSHLNASF